MAFITFNPKDSGLTIDGKHTVIFSKNPDPTFIDMGNAGAERIKYVSTINHHFIHSGPNTTLLQKLKILWVITKWLFS